MAANGDSTGSPESEEAELVGGRGKQQSNMAAAAAGEGSTASLLQPDAPSINIPLPPLPLRCPPYPKSGNRKALRNWNMECRRISKLAAKDPRRHLPTVIKTKDHCLKIKPKAKDVVSTRDKALVLVVGRSIVDVSSVTLGRDGNILRCTGIVVGWNETRKSARILTSSSVIVDGLDYEPKLHVRLPNNAVMEGQLLFVNKHYRIALLEVSSESDLPLQLPSFGSNPNYGQKVIVLARGQESNLMARHGKILWVDGLDYLGRNYSTFLSCDLPLGSIGGIVIDHDGNVIGMAFVGLKRSILAISTIITCIEMWLKFS